jgi:hypothetical protein
VNLILDLTCNILVCKLLLIIKELPVMVMKTDLLNVIILTGLLRIAVIAKM